MDLNFINKKKKFLLSHREKLARLQGKWLQTRPSPQKWAAVEILGHLVDSAINNLTRFINGPKQQNLIFPGYDQDHWVQVQNYLEADWHELLNLWWTHNKQIITILENIPDEQCEMLQREHNFDRIAFRPVKKEEPMTLKFLIEDYYLHMAHHFEQIYALQSKLTG